MDERADTSDIPEGDEIDMLWLLSRADTDIEDVLDALRVAEPQEVAHAAAMHMANKAKQRAVRCAKRSKTPYGDEASEALASLIIGERREFYDGVSHVLAAACDAAADADSEEGPQSSALMRAHGIRIEQEREGARQAKDLLDYLARPAEPESKRGARR